MVCACVRACVCAYAYMRRCICVCVCVCVHVYVHTDVHDDVFSSFAIAESGNYVVSEPAFLWCRKRRAHCHIVLSCTFHVVYSTFLESVAWEMYYVLGGLRDDIVGMVKGLSPLITSFSLLPERSPP